MKSILLFLTSRSGLLTGLLWALLGTLLSGPLQAQSTDASIAGIVRDQQGAAVPGATVMVKNNSNGFQTGGATSTDGRYAFRQLPLGGPYEVNVSFVGSAAQQRTGYTLNQGDRITVDFQLSEAAAQLQEVVVSANSLTSRVDRLGSSTAFTAQEVNRLPTTNRDFTSLANLAPTSNGTNIGSQLASSTNYIIDGLSARNMLTSGPIGRGPYTLSLEAIREFEVAYNVYDVT